MKALTKEDEAFKYISNMFPHLSKAQFEGGIFSRPGVRKMIQSQAFLKKKLYQRNERSFRKVVVNFVGNTKCENYEQLINFFYKIMKSWGAGCL